MDNGYCNTCKHGPDIFRGGCSGCKYVRFFHGMYTNLGDFLTRCEHPDRHIDTTKYEIICRHDMRQYDEEYYSQELQYPPGSEDWTPRGPKNYRPQKPSIAALPCLYVEEFRKGNFLMYYC
jgi:hypothetical protein